MNPDIEQILLAQAAQEASSGPSMGGALAVGAGGGAALGALMGQPVHMVGKAIGGKGGLLKPGARMAGSLVGALIGGGLGAAAQKTAMMEAGPAGKLLAKIQAQGGVTADDQMLLEAVLRDAYSQQGIL